MKWELTEFSIDVLQIGYIVFCVWLVLSGICPWWVPVLIYGPHMSLYYKWK